MNQRARWDIMFKLNKRSPVFFLGKVNISFCWVIFKIWHQILTQIYKLRQDCRFDWVVYQWAVGSEKLLSVGQTSGPDIVVKWREQVSQEKGVADYWIPKEIWKLEGKSKSLSSQKTVVTEEKRSLGASDRKYLSVRDIVFH